MVSSIELNTMLTYPSDYSFGAAVFFSGLAIILRERVTIEALQKLIVPACALVIFLIGLSRVFYGRNYPADVVAALSAGLAWACFMRYATDLVASKRLAKSK